MISHVGCPNKMMSLEGTRMCIGFPKAKTNVTNRIPDLLLVLNVSLGRSLVIASSKLGSVLRGS